MKVQGKNLNSVQDHVVTKYVMFHMSRGHASQRDKFIETILKRIYLLLFSR